MVLIQIPFVSTEKTNIVVGRVIALNTGVTGPGTNKSKSLVGVIGAEL